MNLSNDLSQPLLTLVVGGTGKTGRRVAERLTARGAPVRVASRSGAPAFDWFDAATWPGALEGVSRVYLAYSPDLALPGAAEHIGAFTKLAAERGVRRIVLLSGRGEPQVEPSERAVKESGVAYTILRAAWFAQNFSEGHFHGAMLEGELAFPAGEVAEPFVDLDDVADVAVVALTEEGHAGKTYELTGPRLLTFREAAAEIGRAAGRTIRYVPVSKEAYGEVLSAHLPPDVAAFMNDLFAYVLDGHNASTTDGVERVLGRPARDFRSYAEGAAASWTV